jgi:glycosyltransferase involved in cell wall biosynthesis
MSAQPGGRPRVHQVLATLGYGDAIGHEVLGIQRVLQRAGYDSEIFVETADPRLEHLTVDYRDLVRAVSPADLLIHHFSIGSRASRTAYALPGRMALVYHNITPPEYFIGVHKDLVKLCFRGRRELTAYTGRCELALGDSEYNRQELEALGFRSTGVLPVVPGFEHLDGTPDHILAAGFDDGWTNVVFVGRVIPNKKFEDVIRAFHAYRTRHNPRSRLLLIGSYSGFERYLAMLQALVARLGTPDVHFLGHVSNEELTALYDVADLFLCASEHEGFCVPIIEAFYKRVPVLAYAATAVPATMDGGGVLYDTKDAFEIARLMEAVLDDTRIEAAVLQSQDAALQRLRGRDFDATLLRFVDAALAAPPRGAPEVAWDFWQQFDQFERLEELRQFRPALYRALPIDPRLAARDSRPVRDQSDESEQTETRAMPVAPRLVSRDSPSARTHSDESQSPSEPPAVSREPRS